FETLLEEKVVLSEVIRSKASQRGFLNDEIPKQQEPEVEDLGKKATLHAGDYEKISAHIARKVTSGNLKEADGLSTKVLAGLNAPRADHRVAAVHALPSVIGELSRNDKWKNVEFSLAFLLTNHFRKESEDGVIGAYISYFSHGFQRKYEAKDYAGCREF